MSLTRRVFVPVKRVIDYAIRPRVKADKSGVDLTNVKMSINPFCAIAVEQGLKLREAKVVDEVIAVSVGPKASEETIRNALAMGADRGILIETDLSPDQELQPLAVAKALAKLVAKEEPGLVVMGKQAIDDDCNATGQMLAGLLGWPQGTFASQLAVGDQSIDVTREVDGGAQTVRLTTPAVVTVDLRLNTPRFTSLPNIVKAKKKPLDVFSAADLGVDLAPTLVIEQVVEPPARTGSAQIVESVDELIDKLKNEAKVL